jgi:hypothetical protein
MFMYVCTAGLKENKNTLGIFSVSPPVLEPSTNKVASQRGHR